MNGHNLPNKLSKTAKKLLRRTEENLTPLMKQRRDQFIAEYLVDWRGPAAWIRSGGSPNSAAKMAYELLREPYVTRKIREQVDAMEEANLINRNRILAGLVREANYQGVGASHGARVSAYHVLAKILGMEAPVKVEAQVSCGVMLIPAGTSVDNWERDAIDVQAQLKADVRK
jgi:phage terminase small subunit